MSAATTSTKSSPVIGIIAIVTAFLGFIGFVMGIIAVIMGLSKKPTNTTNVVLGAVSILISLGAMLIQFIVFAAFLSSGSTTDLGSLKTYNGQINGSLNYTMQLPKKFEREVKDAETERFIYRSSDSEIVTAILLVNCTPDMFDPSEYSSSDLIPAIATAIRGIAMDTSELQDLGQSFGGVLNVSIGQPEPITGGRYASKGYAATLYGEHPISNEAMYGEMHMMLVDDRLCSGAWLATDEVHEENEFKMDEALSSIAL